MPGSSSIQRTNDMKNFKMWNCSHPYHPLRGLLDSLPYFLNDMPVHVTVKPGTGTNYPPSQQFYRQIQPHLKKPAGSKIFLDKIALTAAIFEFCISWIGFHTGAMLMDNLNFRRMENQVSLLLCPQTPINIFKNIKRNFDPRSRYFAPSSSKKTCKNWKPNPLPGFYNIPLILRF